MTVVRSGDSILVSVISRFSRAGTVTAMGILSALLDRGISLILCNDNKKFTSAADVSEILMLLVQQSEASKSSADKLMYAKAGHRKRIERIEAGESPKVTAQRS